MTPTKEETRRLLCEVLERKVAARAYELYVARGGAEGAALDDWLQAEKDVLGQSIQAPLFSQLAAEPMSTVMMFQSSRASMRVDSASALPIEKRRRA